MHYLATNCLGRCFSLFMQVKKRRSPAQGQVLFCLPTPSSFLLARHHQDSDTSVQNIFQCLCGGNEGHSKRVNVCHLYCNYFLMLSSRRSGKKRDKEDQEGWHWLPCSSRRCLTSAARRHTMYAASAFPVPCLCQTAAQSSSPVCTVPCRNKHLTPVSLLTWRPRQDPNLIKSWSLSSVSPSKSLFSQWLSSSSL